MADTEHWRSYLTDGEVKGTEQSSNDQAELNHLLNNQQPDVEAGESAAASTGKKRKGRKPTQTPDQKKTKKNACDRDYRRRHSVKQLSLFLFPCQLLFCVMIFPSIANEGEVQ